jgi:phosphomannomutase
VIAPIDHRVRSGEINNRVDDIPAMLETLKKHFHDGKIDELDGITIQYNDWWMNVRPSNTEPLLRLNLEGDSKSIMEQRRDEVLRIITKG